MTLTIAALYLDYANLSLTQNREIKELDPLIHYEYSNDRFVAISSPDIEIKSVDWSLPDMENDQPALYKINQYSKDLIIRDLKNSLSWRLFSKKSNIQVVNSFIDCYIFGSEYYKGIPVIITTEFRYRGNQTTSTLTDLAYIKGSSRDKFYIKTEQNQVNEDEIIKFITASQEDYVNYERILNEYDLSGECGIIWGTPDI